jgi:hypothetical protein
MIEGEDGMERPEPVEASHPQTDQKYLADLIDVSGILKAPPPLKVQESSSTMSKGVCGFILQESDYLNASPFITTPGVASAEEQPGTIGNHQGSLRSRLSMSIVFVGKICKAEQERTQVGRTPKRTDWRPA